MVTANNAAINLARLGWGFDPGAVQQVAAAVAAGELRRPGSVRAGTTADPGGVPAEQPGAGQGADFRGLPRPSPRPGCSPEPADAARLMERYHDMQLFVALAGQPSLAAAARSAPRCPGRR